MLTMNTKPLEYKTVKLEKTEQKTRSKADVLSHEFCTPLHAINSYFEFLEKFVTNLKQAIDNLHATETSFLPKDHLGDIAIELKNKLFVIHDNLAKLSEFVSNGKCDEYILSLKTASNKESMKFPSLEKVKADLYEITSDADHFKKIYKKLLFLHASLDSISKKDLITKLTYLKDKAINHLWRAKHHTRSLILAIPRAPKELPFDVSSNISMELPALDHLKILVVEDNFINQKILSKILGKIKCQIVNDGREAVDLFLTKPNNRFDLVFMDLHMPHLDGYEATKQIRKIESEGGFDPMPIIALTADAPTPENKAKVAASGMNDFCSKPFKPSHIFQLIYTYAIKNISSADKNKSKENVTINRNNKIPQVNLLNYSSLTLDYLSILRTKQASTACKPSLSGLMGRRMSESQIDTTTYEAEKLFAGLAITN